MNTVSNQHKKDAVKAFKFAIISISTSRYEKYGSGTSPVGADDISGKIMMDLVEENGHNLVDYCLVSDEMSAIKEAVTEAILKGADIVITTGGTGLTPSDVTIESIVPMFEKQMPGFGELFRYKSTEQIGPAVMLTRADAGIMGGSAVFCLPGSPGAVELALSKIILPEVGHIIKHIR
ncbi:MogA/MoaB family molybdenum cofactor biosynthesis protein [Methanococcoides burtonii]|uniref:Molybdenum cofactor biosynthesis protein B n=1 Tax=Methanococcoides burtonii (strain DSM 6242 / NBRC 107633 / OCM 468 / ACE-M) TaxID=259564 RepID=Q12W44_METBU|nr:MogA/MoaB family molybdenum cofactor biosynthesis protein [Methanococcoides burtonii]ABE52332.1 Molybdenum cofactor biosynthesis protein B [Methanococcoides burtonii DSM 6242]